MSYENAVKDLLKFARMTQGILAITPALEKLGSLDQALIETQARLDRLRADEDAAKDRVAAADAAVNNANQTARDAVAEAGTEATRILEEAQNKADSVVKAAQDRGDALVEDAMTRAKTSEAAVKLAESQLLDLQDQADKATATRDAMNAEIAAIRAKLG